MGIRTEAWWVCGICNSKIAKVKSRKFRKAVDEHRKACIYNAACSIKQIKQGERNKY